MTFMRRLIPVLTVAIIAAGSSTLLAETLTLACTPREQAGYVGNRYDRSIKLTVDTARRVVELILPSGEGAWKTSTMSLYPTPGGGNARGPLLVEISTRRITWGSPNGYGYADFNGTVDRETGDARVYIGDPRGGMVDAVLWDVQKGDPDFLMRRSLHGAVMQLTHGFRCAQIGTRNTRKR